VSKGKIAFYWAGSCGGCEVAIVDLDEMLFDVLENFDIVFWPCAMDAKYSDVEAMDNSEIDVCFFNGCIRNDENKEIAEMLRAKSKIMIAFGSCSHLGGIPGLGNLSTKDETLDYVYKRSKSVVNDEGTIPQNSTDEHGNFIGIPELREYVKALDDVVEVDYYIPGCPPPVDVIKTALLALISGEVPPRKEVLAPDRTVCHECKKEKRDMAVKSIKRIYQLDDLDPKRCLLEQGILCMGPATREGCGAACLTANMPCTGCMGPPSMSELSENCEQGARMVSAITSMTDVADEKNSKEEEIKTALDEIRDPVGVMYMYSMPKSILRRRRKDVSDRD